ncbi:MAG: metallophosphoesterase family protein [Alphaproteobacteria bacterium]
MPHGTRVYAIGDIHGRLDLLLSLEDKIQAHAVENPVDRAVVVYIGDYIDRGYQSRGVIDHLLEPPRHGLERIFLKGNHEDFLLRFLENVDVGPIWLVNGGRETLMSYEIALTPAETMEQMFEAAQKELKDALPPSHLEFLRALRISHVEGDYLFVHAGVRPGRPLEEQKTEDLLWIRDDFLESDARHCHIVVHGHTPSRNPELRSNRIGIDTGAFATGCLTCVVLEGSTQSFLTN